MTERAELLAFSLTRAEDSAALGAAEGNVNDGLEVNGLAFPRSRLKFPLSESLDGVGVKLGVDAAHKLNAIHGAVQANHTVEDHFSFHVILDECLRIFRVNLAQSHGRVDLAKAMRGTSTEVQFGKMDDPTARGAVQIGHVDVHGIDAMRGEDQLRLRAGWQRRKIGRADALRRVIGGGIRIGALQAGLGFRKAELQRPTKTCGVCVWLWRTAADADADIALTCPACVVSRRIAVSGFQNLVLFYIQTGSSGVPSGSCKTSTATPL